MPADFSFAHELAFEPNRSAEHLRALPEAPGVLALFGQETHGQPSAQPFLTRTTNLRRRAQRLLLPPPAREQPLAPDGTPLPSRRLNLRDRVARVAWSATGSEFESLLLLYDASAALFGLAEARRRLKLHTPFFVRFTAEHAHPRVYVTNRLSARALAQTYGPFPSRLAAERFADATLDLFKLRRCWEDLVVHPEHPGCAYGEMRRCLAPCNTTCTAEEYTAEARAVDQFFRTRGESLLATIAAERDQASDEMDFERAAERHRQHEKVKAAVALADELVRPIPDLRAVIVQRAGPALRDSEDEYPEQAALFLLHAGRLAGPARLSTLGVRAVREQTAVGSSLFAQPLMLAPVPLAPVPRASEPQANPTADVSPFADDGAMTELPAPPNAAHRITPLLPAMDVLSPEDRARQTLALLETRVDASAAAADVALLSDHLALLRRWYYRPEKQRVGELLLPNPDGSWPVRRLLNAAARAVLGDPKTMKTTDREGARALKTKLLHPGREGIERAVPVLDQQTRDAAARDAQDHAGQPAVVPPVFRSRRSRTRAAGPLTPEPAGKLPLP